MSRWLVCRGRPLVVALVMLLLCCGCSAPRASRCSRCQRYGTERPGPSGTSQRREAPSRSGWAVYCARRVPSAWPLGSLSVHEGAATRWLRDGNGSQWATQFLAPGVWGSATFRAQRESLYGRRFGGRALDRSALDRVQAVEGSSRGVLLFEPPLHRGRLELKRNRGVAERWNGKRWSRQPFGGSLSYPTPHGVSCPSRRSCTAVGNYESGDGTLWWLAHWNGASWSLENDPGPPSSATGGGFLQAVSCASPSACVATGGIANGNGTTTSPLASRWNGTVWSAISP